MTIRPVAAVVVVSLGLLFCACASEPADVDPNRTEGPVLLDPDDQIPSSWTAIELTALDALKDQDRYFGARYEADAATLVVTIFTHGVPVTADEIAQTKEAVERALNGLDIEIDIEVDEGEAPSQGD